MKGILLEPRDHLQQIEDCLARGDAPGEIIGKITPSARHGAVSWARQLTFFDDLRGQYSNQVIDLAHTVARCCMRIFNLTVTGDGRVVDQSVYSADNKPITVDFTIAIGGDTVRVRYTPYYFDVSGTDNFYFTNDSGVGQAHAVSESGYFSQFVPHDAVEAFGGPVAFAQAFAEAKAHSDEDQFMVMIEGQRPENQQSRKSISQSNGQRSLFEE